MKKGETFEFIKLNIKQSTWKGHLMVCSNMVSLFGVKYLDQSLTDELFDLLKTKLIDLDHVE